jgi:hypothetical protein
MFTFSLFHLFTVRLSKSRADRADVARGANVGACPRRVIAKEQAMSTYPESPRAAFLAWCEAHAPVFIANAAQIGLSTAQAAGFNVTTGALAAALLAQEQAKQAYRAATADANAAFATLRGSAGETVRLIRAFAESQPKPSNVYMLAEIPPPAAPSPVPPPGQPTNLVVGLTPASGDLTLRWKCTNPPGAAGTSYIVRRRLPGETEFAFLGVTGRKEFIDDSLIAGPDSVQYTVQGQRSDSSGPLSEIFTVNFGQLGGGFGVTSFAGTTDPRFESAAMGNAALAATPSTVNGRTVAKTLSNGNGNGNGQGQAKRSKSR